jgi:tRNA (guanine-N7-)-methyltransferase
MGNFFWKIALENPNKNLIGMEIRYKRLYQSADKARKWKNNNFVLLKDFGQNIDKIFSSWEIAESYIFFPDPWSNKERQRKHRLLQEDFLQKLYDITQIWGKLFFKTDHREYFESTKKIVEEQNLWNIGAWTYNYENSEIFDMKNITEFEALYRGTKTDIHYIELLKL